MASTQAEQGKTIRIATACTECQRRKQKCSREWPCNHCQARRIAHLCKFTPKKVLTRTGAGNTTTATTTTTTDPAVHNNTRPTEGYIDNSANVDVQDAPQKRPSGPGIPTFAGNGDIRVIGYLPSEQELALGHTGTGGSAAITNTPQNALLPEMESALRAVPPKPYTDILVQHFLGDTNYHYYALYPPTFSHDYSVWWSSRTRANVLTPEFTCLLLRVCACSALYLDKRLQEKLESELGESVQTLSERYHHAAQRLSSTISPGKGGLSQIQQLFLTAFWYKTEGLFIESWHWLGSSIHQAQELGLYKRTFRSEVSEFEREMRRRVWCVLYAWDWQMSVMLARPFIINTNYYGFELPNLRLEGPDIPEGLPSPIAHIALQCQLGRELSKIPEVMGGVLSPDQAGPIQQGIENWMASFPPALRLTDPDTQYDANYHYVTFQRYQLNAIGHMLTLVPVKLSLTRPVGSATSEADRAMREKAVYVSLKLIDISRQLLDCLLPHNAKFYLGTFLVFDTAAYLCSAIAHDHTYTLPQREKVIDAIISALGMLEQVRNTKLGATCYAIIRRILLNLPSDVRGIILYGSSSPESSAGGPKTPSDGHHDTTTSPSDPLATDVNGALSAGELGSGLPASTGLGPPSDGVVMSDLTSLNDLASMDLGALAQIWDWGYLGFGP